MMVAPHDKELLVIYPALPFTLPPPFLKGMSMSVIIFGNGPMPNEPDFAVTAPGSRTWQIIRTVADGLVQAKALAEGILVFGLDETHRESAGKSIHTSVISAGQQVSVEYRPLPYTAFRELGTSQSTDQLLPANIRAVIATGSVQPYSTAAGFAHIRSLPLWVDIFGDPLCETQSQLELSGEANPAAAETQMVHVWKLLLDALLEGDRFYGLSQRQRHAIQGQLGCAGRLNQFTAPMSLCHYLPYAVFEDDTSLPSARQAKPEEHFTLMWCGSFNTWMDVPTLTRGITGALRSNPNMRLIVVGGKIPGYNEISYAQFLAGIREAEVEGVVTLLDWQPLSAMQKLYAQCDLGLSIDRYTYEAELGSRTRLINFLAAGVPVASTVVTELSVELQRDGMLAPFNLGSPESLTHTLISASEGSAVSQNRGQRSRQYIMENFNGSQWGSELRKWLANPQKAPDKNQNRQTETTNALADHWRTLRASLGA